MKRSNESRSFNLNIFQSIKLEMFMKNNCDIAELTLFKKSIFFKILSLIFI